MEVFRQDVFWKELLIEKRECSEKMLNLRRKRVAGEREDEVLAMKKKLQEIVECLKGREELLRKDEEFNFEGRMKEWLKKSGEKEKEEKKEVVVVGGEEQDDFLKALKNLSLSSSSASSLPTDLTLKKIDALPKLRTERTPPIIDFLTFLRDFRRKMKNYVSQKSAWIRYLIEAVDGVGRREIEARWESVKGLGDEEGFNRMVEYLSMRLFGDGYWWEFEAEAEKEGKQRVGEGVKNFIEKVRIFAEKLGWDESKIKRTVLLGVREEFRGWLEVGGKYRRNWMMMDLEEIVFNFENAEDSPAFHVFRQGYVGRESGYQRGGNFRQAYNKSNNNNHTTTQEPSKPKTLMSKFLSGRSKES